MLFGILSFLSLSTGMILFVRASVYFYWFGIFFGYFTLYLMLSYIGIGIWGKDFDPVKHDEIKKQNFDFLPNVDVFLPICGESMDVVKNTWDHVAKLDWPHLKVHVLDDGDSAEARALAARFGFNYIVRDNRPELKKAGNLRYAFSKTDGEFIIIFDADFCPRPDFVREVIPYFQHDDKIAIVQTPQYFRVRKEQTWVERGAGVVQELFYRLIQVNRNRFGASICVGTCGTYRRSSLVPFGGTAPIGYSEDVHTGFSVVTTGWKLVYVPVCLAMGVCPDTMPAFFIQQYRWCMGSSTLLTNPEFWKCSMTAIQKLSYLSGMLYYSATAIGIFTNPIPGALLIWIKPEAVIWYNIAFAIPSLLFSSVVMRLWARQPYGTAAAKVKVIQNYAHLIAIKDLMMNTKFAWVPSGGSARGKRSSKFKQAQIVAIVWVLACTSAVISGAVLRILQGYWWVSFFPTMFLSVMNFAYHVEFMLCRE
jgi:cellulose synthase/poly-beta-1,6-N-acetylglucosamine synthase-like glycosyltransferase